MTDSEMQRMQQEAIRRTQEMQRRAAVFNKPPERSANRVPNVPDTLPPPPVNEVPKERPPEEPARIYHKPPDARDNTMISGGIFETLFKDKEKTLILGILLLLMDEKTDNALIMALMYLLI